MHKRQMLLMIVALLVTLVMVACQQGSDDDEMEASLPTGNLIDGSEEPALARVTETSTLVPTVTTPAPTDTGSAIADNQSDPPATATAIPTSTPTSPNVITEITSEPGALVSVQVASEVGVLLDDFPAEMRDRVAAALLDESTDYWRERAARQVRLTRLRLNFRDVDYPGRGQLPLPPSESWEIELESTGPQRREVDGHDLVMIGYTFRSILLTDAASPGEAEPALNNPGGTWSEPFVFPADPDMLLQRTDNACINEAGFPPNSYDAANAWQLYDFTCEADDGGVTGCHRVTLPQLSCLEALDAAIGQVQTAVEFEHLEWDAEIADSVRIGTVSQVDVPDLRVVGEDLTTNRIVYRYIEPENCALQEGAVGAPGWRRLLLFDATVHNIGGEALHVGQVGEDDEHNVFVYNACHNHFHYANYGTFFLENIPELTASKQAFCVQSTSRYSNNELSPLTHSYSCRFQGIQAGWVDEYIAGLDTQWIDITELELPAEGRTVELGFSSNDDQFLCEGRLGRDENGQVVWEPTEFTTEDGHSISRPACDFFPDWDTNNEATEEVFVPEKGGHVTQPCGDDVFGARRNCGFEPLADEPLTCTAGEPVELNLTIAADAAPQVVRACEWSEVLGTGTACEYNSALDNVTVMSTGSTLRFNCPLVRDAEDAMGAYFLYSAPVWPADGSAEITTSGN